MRTIMVLAPQSMSLRPWMMLMRACALSSGATASSTSRNTMSAAERAAFSNKPLLDPGTASSERCSRAVAGSMLVKLMGLSLKTLGRSLARRTETGGGTIDGHQQGGAQLLAAAGAMRAQQVHLLAADRVDGFQPALEAPPELREASGDGGIARDAQYHLAGQPVFFL